ncbi:hypothetical protein [Bacillus thuringiensis]|uniref:hypothetical protein n=1 Tax=Bacillus thuringiensis TaxID=1428 RepID=UPI000BFCE0A4|nr:hypothetical protein [Bacillus thuringiensis]PGT90122.1 hypothetical protein COD17_10255 [Bacillus thuringiensis]
MSYCIGETKKGIRNFIILYVVCIIGIGAKVHTGGYTFRDNWIDYILLVYFLSVLMGNVKKLGELQNGGNEDE